jgi:hypothetical protein
MIKLADLTPERKSRPGDDRLLEAERLFASLRCGEVVRALIRGRGDQSCAHIRTRLSRYLSRRDGKQNTGNPKL